MSFASKLFPALAGAALFSVAPQIAGPGLLPPLVAPATAQAAENVELDNIVFGGDMVEVRISKATVIGSSLSESDLRNLFSEDNKTSVVERLQKLSAKEIRIPELTIIEKTRHTSQTVHYRNVVLTDIESGRVGHAGAVGGAVAITVDNEDKKSSTLLGSIGALTIEDFDTVLATRIYTEGTGKGAEESTRKLERLYGPFSLTNYKLNGSGIDLSIGKIEGAGISARQGRESLLDLLPLFETAGDDFKALSKEKQRRILAGFADMLSSFDIGDTTISNISFATTDKEATTVKIDTVKGRFVDQAMTFSLDGISASGSESTVKIAGLTLDSLSFKSTVDALIEASKQDLKDAKEELEGFRFAPTGGNFKVTGVDVDIALATADDEEAATDGDEKNTEDGTATENEEEEGTSASSMPERAVFSIAEFSSNATGYVRGVASSYTTKLSKLRFAIPDSEEQSDIYSTLTSLGYKALELSADFQAKWDESAGMLTIDSLSFQGQDIGSVDLHLQLGNIGRLAFMSDPDAALKALEKSFLHNFTLAVEDRGLAERLVNREVKANRDTTSEEVRQQYAAFATLGIPAVLGDNAVSKRIASAISKFVTAPGKLTIAGTAKDPAGVPVTVITGEQDPSAFLNRFSVTATND